MRFCLTIASNLYNVSKNIIGANGSPSACIPVERSHSLNKAVTSPIPEDRIHNIHIVLDEPASSKYPCLSAMNSDHAPE